MEAIASQSIETKTTAPYEQTHFANSDKAPALWSKFNPLLKLLESSEPNCPIFFIVLNSPARLVASFPYCHFNLNWNVFPLGWYEFFKFTFMILHLKNVSWCAPNGKIYTIRFVNVCDKSSPTNKRFLWARRNTIKKVLKPGKLSGMCRLLYRSELCIGAFFGAK